MNCTLAKASLCLALIPATLAAQTRGADGTRLREGVDTMLVYLIQGADTTRTGRVIDQLTSGAEGGKPVWLRIYRSSDLLSGTRLDSLTDLTSDLAPVRHRSVSPAGREVIDFVAGEAKGWRRSHAGDSTIVQAKLPAGTINASSFDLYLRAGPLGAGYELSIPAFVSLDGTVITLTAKVVGEERIAGADCWRIEANFAGMSVTFWVRKNGRQLEQQVLYLKPLMSMLYRRPGAAS